MGKRKERRIAAMIGAGRRVKLDLFAEPSGDSGGSSAQDELGGDMDPQHRAGSPNSPSSSGKQPENPLLLLGQYSDDELDEESSKPLDHATAEKSTADNDEQVKGLISTENEDMDDNPSMDVDTEKDIPHHLETGAISGDASQSLEDLDGREIDSAVTGDLCKEVVSGEETSAVGTSDVQLSANLISCWKVVLHEESNQYYYWNTVTGQTSWVVPDELAQGTELTGEQRTAADTEGRNSLVVELDGPSSKHAIDHAGNVIHEPEEVYEPGPQMEEQNESKDEGLEEKRWGVDANQTEAKISFDAAGGLYHKTSSLGDNASSWESGDALLSNGNATYSDSEKYISNPMVHEEYDSENELGSSVLKHCENLLDRLKLLEGSRNNMQGHDWISKYIWEVEIRLSDIKSLLPFGSSLLPFWVHCEGKLTELEGAIDNDVSQFFKYGQICEAESHKSLEREGNEIEANGNGKTVEFSAFDNYHASADVVSFQKDSKNDAANNNAFHGDAIGCPTAHSGGGTEGNSGVHEVAQVPELTAKTELHAGEDVDMDVDMEVEDEIPANDSITRDPYASEYCAPTEQPIQPNALAGQESFVPPETFGIPPPPDDDWIPPPPPDNELVPPPPPDDPSETSYPPPPTYFETVQPLSYTEQYNLSYPGSNFQYYSQANTDFSTHNNVHGHAEGHQVAVAHQPLYYEALPSTYTGAAPALVNLVEPVGYYGLQDGAVLPGPVVTGAQTSVLYSVSGHETLGSDQITSVESHAEASYTSLPNTEVGVSTVNGGTEKVEVPFAMTSLPAPATISVVESAPESTSTVVAPVAIAAKSTATNAKSKVTRGKKRTVAAVSTLKSNKKVSSLVDKWKAAKEELHEDEEDEPENAYEILEKKRQREIEEWRAQQIATGEAKANANFQPLGGDWRERVKRKRAQMKREGIQNSSASLADGNQQPDLNELSRDLPSGWQVYWDESSKQVYYGNTITSETTWTRPAK